MTLVLIASVAYLLTTAATIWLIRRHLVRMRGDVRALVKLFIDEAVADTKSCAKQTITGASRALSEEVTRFATRSDHTLSDGPRSLVRGILKGLAGAARRSEQDPE